MENYYRYKDKIDSYIRENSIVGEPNTLYEPIQYIMHLDGKRFRPVLLLMAAACFGEIDHKTLKVAHGLELFHNFTLVHDDIMDKAEKRRGDLTVHKKYNINTALLAGDLMLIKATHLIHEVAKSTGKTDLVDLFLETATEICEGQQWDMDFENTTLINLDGYLQMVSAKTAVLLGFSLYAGARLSGLDKANANALYQFGTDTGIAFQIWDDYLDVFGTKDTGKKKAGDIYNKKETFLIIRLRGHLKGDDLQWFKNTWSKNIISTEDSSKIIQLMKKYKVDLSAEKYSNDKLETAIQSLKQQLPSNYDYKEIIDLARNFINRNR